MAYGVEINQRVGKKVSKKWLTQIVAQTLKAVGAKNAELSVAFVGGAEMKKLNKQWRGKDKVTDVLSFDYSRDRRTRSSEASEASFASRNAGIAGEIIICYPQAVRQAKERGHGVGDEIKMLLVHGLLHLCGYEHEKSLSKAKEMEKLQSKILAGFH